MKLVKLTLIAAITLAGLSACQPSDPQLTSPPPKPVVLKPEPKIERPVVEVSAKGLTVTYDSRVDILFVIDDSLSMKAHQESLSRNMGEFVDGFSKNKAIDFHIGYTTVWDRSRYGVSVPASCGLGQPGTLKSLVGQGAPSDRRYLTASDTNFRQLLRDNLDPNLNKSLVKDIYNPDVCMQGPENEESFAPALGALEDPTVVNGPNKGFRRQGAFLVVIFVSDAKDASVNFGVTAKDFVHRLQQDTGEIRSSKKQFRVYTVAVGPGTQIGKSACLPDPAFADSSVQGKDGHTHYVWPASRTVREGENPLVDAARLTEDASSPKDGQFLSICDRDYGAALARFGYQIQQDTLSDMALELPYLPQIVSQPNDQDPDFDAKLKDFNTKRLRVYIGDVELAEAKQWSYNPQSTSVIVYGQKIDWNKYPGEKVRVSYTPADMTAKTTRPINL